MKRTTCKQLFLQHSFEEIVSAFTALWKYNEPEKSEHLDLPQWERLYQHIREQEAKPSGCYIVVGYRWEGCMPMVDMNCAVFTQSDHQLLHPVAEHPSWAEVLGMELVVEEDVRITQPELAAGMFWEMTYYGMKER